MREVEMLDTLSDMEVAEKIKRRTNEAAHNAEKINLLDRRFEQLGMDELEPLPHETSEFTALKDYLINVGHRPDPPY